MQRADLGPLVCVTSASQLTYELPVFGGSLHAVSYVFRAFGIVTSGGFESLQEHPSRQHHTYSRKPATPAGIGMAT